jgi:lysozyme family protein
MGRENMTSNWPKAISFSLGWEGEYSWDKDDPGGETKWGISKKSYPNLIIKDVTKEQAMEIHKRDRWDAMGCDDLPDKLDICVFDCAMNQGVTRAQIILEQTQDWRDYLILRIMRYNDLGKTYPMFIRGWLNRALALWKTLK